MKKAVVDRVKNGGKHSSVTVLLRIQFFKNNVFKLPEETPPPPLCRLARPARWGFATILLGILYMYRIHSFYLKDGKITQRESITRKNTV